MGGLILAMVSPRILLIDDHAMFRAGLCMVIAVIELAAPKQGLLG